MQQQTKVAGYPSAFKHTLKIHCIVIIVNNVTYITHTCTHTQFFFTAVAPGWGRQAKKEHVGVTVARFYRLDALPVTKPRVSNQRREFKTLTPINENLPSAPSFL